MKENKSVNLRWSVCVFSPLISVWYILNKILLEYRSFLKTAAPLWVGRFAFWVFPTAILDGDEMPFSSVHYSGCLHIMSRALTLVSARNWRMREWQWMRTNMCSQPCQTKCYFTVKNIKHERKKDLTRIGKNRLCIGYARRLLDPVFDLRMTLQLIRRCARSDWAIAFFTRVRKTSQTCQDPSQCRIFANCKYGPTNRARGRTVPSCWTTTR